MSGWHRKKPVFIDFGPQMKFWRVMKYDPKTKEGLVSYVDIQTFVALASSGTTDFSGMDGPASHK